MDAGVWFVATDVDILWIFSTSKLCHNVLWKVNKNRSGAACACNIKSFLDDTAKILTVSYCDTVFCDASCDTYDINLLKSIVSDQMSCNLSGKAYKRNTVIVGCGKSCNQVGCSGTACNQAYTYLSGCSCIGICLVDKSLLMSWEDNVDIVLFI